MDTIDFNGVALIPTPTVRACKECNVAGGTYHKHCKCGLVVNTIEEVDEHFGWRKHHKLKGHAASQGQCRECRSTKSGSSKSSKSSSKKAKKAIRKAKKAAETRVNIPAPEVKVNEESGPAGILPADVKVAASSNACQEEVPAEFVRDGLHVNAIAPSIRSHGDLTPLVFGPISISPREANTPEGASMVPNVDVNFHFETDEAIILANAVKNAENTWVWGHSGTGKTSGIVQICALLNLPLYRLNMSGDVSIDDLVGSTQVVIDPASGKAITRFAYGRLIKAMLNGGVLLIDEVTSAPPHVLMALQEVTEPCDNVHDVWAKGGSHASYVCTANEGETIHAAPGFRVIVTDNTNGQGDVTGLFAGTNTMNEAFRSRFTQWYEKLFPSKTVWRTILMSKTGVDFKTANEIVSFALEVNKGSAALASKTITNNMVINPRDTLAIARHSRTYGSVKIAFNVGLLNSLHQSDPDRVFLKDALKNIVGD